jgi:SAM-dependent methyltransferase
LTGYVKGRVLDIGCGAGRHAIYLQEQGHEVLGIDNSPLAIEVSKKRGLLKARQMPITRVSSKLGIFDTIIMMGNNFGLFANQKRARWLLSRFYAMTPPGGRIIATSRDPYPTEDPQHLAYHERNRQQGRMAGQVRIRVRYRQYKTPWYDYLLVSQDEMAHLLDGTGWAITEIVEPDFPSYGAIIDKVD